MINTQFLNGRFITGGNGQGALQQDWVDYVN